MADHPGFSSEAVNSALAAAHAHNATLSLAANSQSLSLASGEFVVGAECISVTVQDGKICLSLPLGIGSVCLPIPSIIPNGTAAQACLDICTTFGFPTGVKVTVSALGKTIISKTFGKC